MIKYDDSIWRQIKEKILVNLETKVQVGVFDSAGMSNSGELTLAELATIHEYGSANGHVPERSFIRSTMHGHANEYKNLIITLIHSVFEKKTTIKDVCVRLGNWGVDKIQENIRGHIPPPLKESTIVAKGHSLPLIDSGKLYDAVEYKVEK